MTLLAGRETYSAIRPNYQGAGSGSFREFIEWYLYSSARLGYSKSKSECSGANYFGRPKRLNKRR
jgi:hypothetical protein